MTKQHNNSVVAWSTLLAGAVGMATVAVGLSNKRNSKDFLLSTMGGGVIGATIALLFAPKPGRALVKEIVNSFPSRATIRKAIKIKSKLPKVILKKQMSTTKKPRKKTKRKEVHAE